MLGYPQNIPKMRPMCDLREWADYHYLKRKNSEPPRIKKIRSCVHYFVHDCSNIIIIIIIILLLFIIIFYYLLLIIFYYLLLLLLLLITNIIILYYDCSNSHLTRFVTGWLRYLALREPSISSLLRQFVGPKPLGPLGTLMPAITCTSGQEGGGEGVNS